VVASAGAVAVHVHTRAITRRPLRATHAARVHLALLGSAALLLLAWRLHLQTFAAELQQSPAQASQAFPGPHYVDVHVRLPGLRALSYVAVAGAIALAAAPFLADRGSARLARRAAVLPFASLAAIALVALSWAPTFVQRWVVDPDPVTKEAPFLANAIAGTRQAFNLGDVDVHRYDPERIASGELRRNRAQLSHVQLWDSRILRLRMQQLASDTPYYRPTDTTLDAVPDHGEPRLTVISPRELDAGSVRSTGRGWANTRLVYTHGYGAFRLSGTRIGPNASPRSSNEAVPLRQPRIYFGEQGGGAPGWVVVNTRRPEFDQPKAGGPVDDYEYTGSGGISLSSPFVKAAFALRFGSLPLLVSHQITDDSRIILHRDILERLETVAPFIRWDEHPATFVVGGRIVSMVAGYTTTSSYPYSHRTRVAGVSANYARPAVQATVDAYSGRIRLYATDREDPILGAWDDAFPDAFEPISRMPPDLRERLRYPEALFDAQAQLYQRFHVTRPGAFVSGADTWTRPARLSGPIEVAGDIRFDQDDEDELRSRMKPGYSFAAPPGESRPRLLMSTYYSPRGNQNLVATLHGWVNGRGVPKLAARSLPRDQVTPGPAQVSRLVNLTPRVANSLGVRNREVADLGKSSLDSIWLGEPHIVFFGGGILQIQTIYDASNSRGIARIFGVTVFLNGRAGIGDTLREALRQALHRPPSVALTGPGEPAVVGQPVRVRIQVENGLKERVFVSSDNHQPKPFGQRLWLRDGPGVVKWVPRKPGLYHVRVVAHGVDGSEVDDETSVVVKPPRTGPECAWSDAPGPPSVQFAGVPSQVMLGRPVKIGFSVRNGRRETVSIQSGRTDALSWELLVCNGQGAIEWVPTEAGPARVQVLVRGEDRTVEAATDVAVRKPRPKPKPSRGAEE
jgi:uncharacterized membrane protein (UPF0182 family)